MFTTEESALLARMLRVTLWAIVLVVGGAVAIVGWRWLR